MAQALCSLHLKCAVLGKKRGSCMNAFSTAAALTVLAATTAAFAAQTQEQPGSYQQQNSRVLESDRDVGAESGAASCQLRGEALKDAATSTSFAATAAQDGMVEVALAGLALRKSGDNQLRQFALKVVQDYAQSNGGLDAIVKCEGLILPIELDAKHDALIKRLNAKSGRAFESAYLKHIASKHSEAMALFESASMSGDPDVAAFARKGLSMLQEHQLLADNLRAAIGTKVANTR
jgi:putative membrane protein